MARISPTELSPQPILSRTNSIFPKELMVAVVGSQRRSQQRSFWQIMAAGGRVGGLVFFCLFFFSDVIHIRLLMLQQMGLYSHVDE